MKIVLISSVKQLFDADGSGFLMKAPWLSWEGRRHDQSQKYPGLISKNIMVLNEVEY